MGPITSLGSTSLALRLCGQPRRFLIVVRSLMLLCVSDFFHLFYVTGDAEDCLTGSPVLTAWISVCDFFHFLLRGQQRSSNVLDTWANTSQQ